MKIHYHYIHINIFLYQLYFFQNQLNHNRNLMYMVDLYNFILELHDTYCFLYILIYKSIHYHLVLHFLKKNKKHIFIDYNHYYFYIQNHLNNFNQILFIFNIIYQYYKKILIHNLHFKNIIRILFVLDIFMKHIFLIDNLKNLNIYHLVFCRFINSLVYILQVN